MLSAASGPLDWCCGQRWGATAGSAGEPGHPDGVAKLAFPDLPSSATVVA